MATIREFYEKDFENCLRLRVFFSTKIEPIEGAILYDLSGNNSFVMCFIPPNKDLNYILNFITSYGKTKISFDHKITLPKAFHGDLQISTNPLEINSKFYGESEWLNISNIRTTGRLFLYSQTDLSQEEIIILKTKAKELGHNLQFRANLFTIERSKLEQPLAFISHDSKDKQEVAKKIAINLQSMLCPVWYDEFSLNVGDNLRDSIEKGLKECKKCILILSPNFLENGGWGKTEFDSIFTRQIIEEQHLVLPVWYNVTKKDVYNYYPSLLNIKGIDWQTLGEKEVCRQIYNAVTN